MAVESRDNLTSELDDWNLIKGKGSITIPPSTARRVIIDLDDYYCAYPEITTSGGQGSSIRLLWAEPLYESFEGWRARPMSHSQ